MKKLILLVLVLQVVSFSTFAVIPDTPPDPTSSSNTCGPVTLYRTDSPPGGGVVWYWQTDPDGEAQNLGSGATFTAYTSGAYYIRAWKGGFGGGWSVSSGRIDVVVNDYPSAPSTPSASDHCSYSTLTRGTPPGGVTWYWQGTDSNGTSTADSNTTYTADSNTTYYIRAQNSAGCWSASSTPVTVTLSDPPNVPPTPSSSGSACGNVTLNSEGSPGFGENVWWFWQTSSGGESTADKWTKVVSTSGTYYLRAYNYVKGCWSNGASSIYVDANQTPSAPSSPTPTVGCGSSYITRGTPPSGITWYWQGTSSSSTDGSNSNTTYNVTTPGTYYIRSYNATFGCWSSSSTGVYVDVYGAAGAPSVMGASREEAGSVTLYASPNGEGTGIRWYAASSGGSPLATGASYSPSISVTTTFYASSYNTNCESSRTAVVGTVAPKPVISATTSSLKPGGTSTLSTTGSYTTYSWKLNGAEISTSSTVNINKPGTYSVTVTKTGMTGSGISNDKVISKTIDQAGFNYVSMNKISTPGITDENDIETLAIGRRQRSVTYLGGFGNTVQTIVSQSSPSMKDIIQPVSYDSLGRQINQYLPYISSNDDSRLRSYALNNSGYSGSEQYLYYQQTGLKIATDTKPYSYTEVERSPIGRTLSTTGVGTDWYSSNKKVVQDYLLNRSSDGIKLWKLNTSTGLPETSSSYGDYQLSVSVITDENGNQVKVYTDKTGLTVLRMTEAASGVWHQTYYVYDDFGRQAFVIPPQGVQNLASGTPSQTYLDQWAFQYKYDPFGRPVETRTPGTGGWLYTVYDSLNRPVMTQNIDQRTRAEWSFVKYDKYSRAILTGFKVITSSTRSSIQTSVDGQSYHYEIPTNSAVGYTLNQTYPSVLESDLLSISYYDNYNFLGYTGWDAESHTFSFVSELSNSTAITQTTGLPTGSKVRVLAQSPTSTWLNAVQYYDTYYRPIQSLKENHKGNLDRGTMHYAFSGRLIESKLVHNGGETVTVLQKYKYDSAGRVTKIYHNINGAGSDQLVAQYEYNELGQLVDKKLHNTGGSNFLQSVDFRYTIRGWLQSINNAQLGNDSGLTNDETNDYFGMELLYNKTDSIGNSQYYNGNISGAKWKMFGYKPGSSGRRSYQYTYDRSDRMTQATFLAYGSSWSKEANTLNETVSYDYNGNISTLVRKQNSRGLSGATVTSSAVDIDNLTYTYASGLGNRLTKVEDSGPSAGFNNGITTGAEYKYDTLGNLFRDRNKGIDSIKYNALNKVKRIRFTDGKSIVYTYDASGNKLIVKTYGPGGGGGGTLLSTTEYLGGFVYSGTSTTALSFFSSPEGRVVKNGGSFEYQYAIADHQGNTRTIFTSVAPAPLSYTATFEDATQTQEQSDFQNYPTGGNRSGLDLFDNTDNGSTYTHSYLLNGGANSQVGLAKTFHVYPGDSVKIEAWAKYWNDEGGTSNLAGFASSLLSAFGLSAPGGGETGTAASGVNSWGGLVAGGSGETNDGYPKAFVNIVVFDKNYNLLDIGYDGINGGHQVSTSPDVAHDQMKAGYLVKEEGYVYLYISNENAHLIDVYFDDVIMTHKRSNLIQANEYYAFGMQTSNSWTRESVTGNNFLGNGGTELNTYNTNIYDLEFRNFDPVLGRMYQVDPMSHSLSSITPYNYAFNNPVNFNDPRGDYSGAVNFSFECTACNFNPGYTHIEFDAASPGGMGSGTVAAYSGNFSTNTGFADGGGSISGIDTDYIRTLTSAQTGNSSGISDYLKAYGSKAVNTGKYMAYYSNGIQDEEHFIDAVPIWEMVPDLETQGNGQYSFGGIGWAPYDYEQYRYGVRTPADYRMDVNLSVYRVPILGSDGSIIGHKSRATVSATSYVSSSGSPVFARASVSLLMGGNVIESAELQVLGPAFIRGGGQYSYIGEATFDLPTTAHPLQINIQGGWTIQYDNVNTAIPTVDPFLLAPLLVNGTIGIK